MNAYEPHTREKYRNVDRGGGKRVGEIKRDRGGGKRVREIKRDRGGRKRERREDGSQRDFGV